MINNILMICFRRKGRRNNQILTLKIIQKDRKIKKNCKKNVFSDN